MVEVDLRMLELVRQFIVSVAEAKRQLNESTLPQFRVQQYTILLDDLIRRMKHLVVYSTRPNLELIDYHWLEYFVKETARKLKMLIERINMASLGRSLRRIKLKLLTADMVAESVERERAIPEALRLQIKRDQKVLVQFISKTRQPLKKLIDSYYNFCIRKNIENPAEELLYRGKAIKSTDSPLSLGMRNLSVITEKFSGSLPSESTIPAKLRLLVMRGKNVVAQFIIATHRPLKKLIESHSQICIGKNDEKTSVQLLFRGTAIKSTDSPISLGMKNFDVIKEKRIATRNSNT